MGPAATDGAAAAAGKLGDAHALLALIDALSVSVPGDARQTAFTASRRTALASQESQSIAPAAPASPASRRAMACQDETSQESHIGAPENGTAVRLPPIRDLLGPTQLDSLELSAPPPSGCNAEQQLPNLRDVVPFYGDGSIAVPQGQSSSSGQDYEQDDGTPRLGRPVVLARVPRTLDPSRLAARGHRAGAAGFAERASVDMAGPSLDHFRASKRGHSPDVDMEMEMDTTTPRSKARHLPSSRPSIVMRMISHPELAIFLARQLRVQELISLYATSRDFHALVNSRFTTVVSAQAARRAPESARVFPFRCYLSLCQADPARNPHPQAQRAARGEARTVPTFRWLKMVCFREMVVHQIMVLLAEDGVPVPAECGAPLKKMWLLMDIPDNHRRIGLVQNERIFSARDLFFLAMFFVKLDMRFTDPIAGSGSDGLRRMLLAQPSLSYVWRALRRTILVSKLDVVKMFVRWKYQPENRQSAGEGAGAEPIFDVPAAEVGTTQYEAWGRQQSRALLQRPDELVLMESIRRGLRLHTRLKDMFLWGYVDPKTFRNCEPQVLERALPRLEGLEGELIPREDRKKVVPEKKVSYLCGHRTPTPSLRDRRHSPGIASSGGSRGARDPDKSESSPLPPSATPTPPQPSRREPLQEKKGFKVVYDVPPVPGRRVSSIALQSRQQHRHDENDLPANLRTDSRKETKPKHVEEPQDHLQQQHLGDPPPIAADSPKPRRPLGPKSNNAPTPVRAAPAPPQKPGAASVLPPSGVQQQQQQQQAAGQQSRKRRAQVSINRKVYTRLDCIGRGGSGRVYRVMAENCKIYALKRVNLADVDPIALQGYKGEISLLKRLEDVERVVRLYDFEINQEKQVLSVLMEFGESDLHNILASRLNAENACFDPSFTRFYWKEMLECVCSVHALNIVHSDLKPANFVLVRGKLKLIDFGIADAIQDNTVNVHRETQIGTPNYMAPEALIDTNAGLRDTNAVGKMMKLGKPSDVWSLGCILYQMTYGRQPFAHFQNQMQRIMAISNPSVAIEFPARTTIGDVAVPEGLLRVLKGCLTRDQRRRPTIDELLSDSDPFLHPEVLYPATGDGAGAAMKLPDGAVPMTQEMLARILHNVVHHCRNKGVPKDEDIRAWPAGFMKKIRGAMEGGQ
ncbi:Dual-specificity kinase, spindle pole body (SPB) duplication and spindle checkpoint function [Ascosphaera acerosa]|nr:Dual-specificity kinase, spindle pole body (SPB) duplication and spindle checkpoint function [Ascosphaera acerosa]